MIMCIGLQHLVPLHAPLLLPGSSDVAPAVWPSAGHWRALHVGFLSARYVQSQQASLLQGMFGLIQRPRFSCSAYALARTDQSDMVLPLGRRGPQSTRGGHAWQPHRNTPNAPHAHPMLLTHTQCSSLTLLLLSDLPYSSHCEPPHMMDQERHAVMLSMARATAPLF